MIELPKSKGAADEIGSLLYMTGELCKNGHVAPRRTLNGVCVECGKEQCRRWYLRNIETAKSRARDYYRARGQRR